MTKKITILLAALIAVTLTSTAFTQEPLQASELPTSAELTDEEQDAAIIALANAATQITTVINQAVLPAITQIATDVAQLQTNATSLQAQIDALQAVMMH